MSLEQAIKDLTAAVEANTAALGSAGTKPASSGAKPAPKKPEAKKGPTLDQVAKRFGAYMSAEGDDGKANVRKVVQHFEVKKISDLDEAQFGEALAILDQLEAGEDPFSEGDDDDDLM